MCKHAPLLCPGIEQFTRYFYMAGEQDFAPFTKENTVEDPDEEEVEDGTHRNYDKWSAELPQNTHFLSVCKGVPGCKKRNAHRLGVSRLPFIECIGAQRESFYESKLLIALPFFCPCSPEAVEGAECQEWLFRAEFDPADFGGKEIDPVVLGLGHDPVSFEMVANEPETRFSGMELDIVCACCTEERFGGPCPQCQYAVGMHRCTNYSHKVWRKGSLHAGVLDALVLSRRSMSFLSAYSRSLFSLA